MHDLCTGGSGNGRNVDYCEVPLDGAVLAQSLADATAIRALASTQPGDSPSDSAAPTAEDMPRCAVAVLLQDDDSDDGDAPVASAGTPAAAAAPRPAPALTAEHDALRDAAPGHGDVAAGRGDGAGGADNDHVAAAVTGAGLEAQASEAQGFEARGSGSVEEPCGVNAELARDAVNAAHVPGETRGAESEGGAGAQPQDGGSGGADGGPGRGPEAPPV